ncbi:MAG TPA: hypothetical protein VGJ44_01095, partial [Kribbellaceae bacterium]
MTMPPTPTLTLTIRAAAPGDVRAAVRLLADTDADSEIACWIVPDPGTRRAYSLGRAQVAVEHALQHGVVHVARDRGAIIGLALWVPHPSPPGNANLLYPARPATSGRKTCGRCGTA